MEYRNLGRTGLKVSPLCLGTMNFGPLTGEEDSFAIMDRALDLGINFFDTANVYGWKMGEGITEQIVGRWFAQGGGRREKVVIATKVYGRMGAWPVEMSIEECKGGLGMDHYEVRSWLGWHHHMTLRILAHHFLVRVQARLKRGLRP